MNSHLVTPPIYFMQLEQWAEVSSICKDKKHYVVVDMAYQGFATGDLGRDSAGLQLLAKDGHKLMLCQSFSKNMGLYGKNMGLYDNSMVRAWDSMVRRWDSVVRA